MERWEAKSIAFREIPQPSALVVSLALENGNKNGKKEEAKNKKHIHNTYKHIVYCVSNPQIKTQSCLNVQSFRDTSQYELFIIYRKSQSGRWASKRVQETNKQTVLVLVFAFVLFCFTVCRIVFRRQSAFLYHSEYYFPFDWILWLDSFDSHSLIVSLLT